MDDCNGNISKRNSNTVQFPFLTGKLWTYLADLNELVEERLDLIIEQMKTAEGVTEKLKSQNQLEGVGRMNIIRSQAKEVINSELIYG